MSSLRLSYLLALLPILGPGCARSWNFDPPEVQASYQFRHKGDCNAWATSAVAGYRYCASPRPVATDPTLAAYTGGAPAFVSLKEGPTDTDALRAHGEKVYSTICAACHQPGGTGLAGSFPPLAGSGEFYGTPENHARIIVHGLSGPIQVVGQAFNGAMPPQGLTLSDYDIASVATFERTSWGNADGPVLPDVVASVR